MSAPVAPTPVLVLVHRAGSELPAGVPQRVCCLRSTTRGSRAVVYRSAAQQGVVGVVDFVSDAVPREGGRGWAADGVFRPVEPYVPRAALLDDPDLAGVFTHLQSRRRLPGPAGRRLRQVLDGSASL
ncbi:hypothetical protein ACQEVB_18405 [Pseudonocardia sp. CA-107938]|uniref:hypothetical protein n=1 Tax=Pseudonocardia sp. CA-107938 TaxID=3240021 RepID=UPI003D8F65F6